MTPAQAAYAKRQDALGREAALDIIRKARLYGLHNSPPTAFEIYCLRGDYCNDQEE